MVLCSLKAVHFDILEKSIFEEFECGKHITYNHEGREIWLSCDRLSSEPLNIQAFVIPSLKLTKG